MKEKYKKYIGNKAFYMMVMAIAVPIMIQNGLTNFVNLLDNIMVGRLGTEEMSGVSIVNQIIFVYNLCIFGGTAGVGIFTAQYFIPISGMILGNMLSANVIALNSFYGSLNRERQLYLYLLGNGASPSEALTPFMREALIKSFNPTIASMAVMGLIALPGTMTGQILGGSSPSVAIKYQIMLMITIFASSLISVLLTLWISRKKTFDKYGMTKF